MVVRRASSSKTTMGEAEPVGRGPGVDRSANCRRNGAQWISPNRNQVQRHIRRAGRLSRADRSNHQSKRTPSSGTPENTTTSQRNTSTCTRTRQTRQQRSNCPRHSDCSTAAATRAGHKAVPRPANTSRAPPQQARPGLASASPSPIGPPPHPTLRAPSPLHLRRHHQSCAVTPT